MLSKVYAKGQIIIPIGLRQKYDINIGDVVEIKEEKSFLAINPIRKTSLMDVAGSVKSDKPFPTKEVIGKIMEKEMGNDETDRH